MKRYYSNECGGWSRVDLSSRILRNNVNIDWHKKNDMKIFSEILLNAKLLWNLLFFEVNDKFETTEIREQKIKRNN